MGTGGPAGQDLKATMSHPELPENWTDTRETLLEGMLFTLKYLGMTLVERPKGEELSAAAVKRIVATVSTLAGEGGPQRGRLLPGRAPPQLVAPVGCDWAWPCPGVRLPLAESFGGREQAQGHVLSSRHGHGHSSLVCSPGSSLSVGDLLTSGRVASLLSLSHMPSGMRDSVTHRGPDCPALLCVSIGPLNPLPLAALTPGSGPRMCGGWSSPQRWGRPAGLCQPSQARPSPLSHLLMRRKMGVHLLPVRAGASGQLVPVDSSSCPCFISGGAGQVSFP